MGKINGRQFGEIFQQQGKQRITEQEVSSPFASKKKYSNERKEVDWMDHSFIQILCCDY